MIEPKREPGSSAHLSVLDGLRGFAIFLVVLVHSSNTGYHPELWIGPLRLGIDIFQDGGALGVDLFFFLSGFVLFYPYAKAAFGLGAAPTLLHFIDRRFIKIVPSYVLAVLVISAVFTLGAQELDDRYRQIWTHLTFLFPLWRDTDGGISGAMWSIGVEVQFYVLFPLIAAAMSRRPIATYLVVALASNTDRTYLHLTGKMNDLYNQFQLLPQLDIFAIGMLSAYLYLKYRDRATQPEFRRRATIAAVAFGCAILLLIADFGHATRNTPPEWSHAWWNDHKLVFSVTVAGFVLATLFAKTWWQRIVAFPPLIWLSTISYNLYLWHLTIMTQCARSGFPCAGIASPWTMMPNWNRQYFIAYIAISLVIATVVTYLVERPLLALGTRDSSIRFIVTPARRVAAYVRGREQRA